MKIPLDKLNFALNQLKIVELSEDDHQFLTEYYEILTPIVCALKTLSANKYSFGLYLPVLVGLNRVLNENKEKQFMFGMPLAIAIEKGFQQRFSEFKDIFDVEGRSTPLYIAMASNPNFKVNFLGFNRLPSHISSRVFNMLLNAGKEILEAEHNQNRSPDDDVVADGSSFSFGGM